MKNDYLQFGQKNDENKSNSDTISRINSLRHEKNDIESTLAMTQDILSRGGESENNLQDQQKMMKSTKKKQNKYIEMIPQIIKLIAKIN